MGEVVQHLASFVRADANALLFTGRRNVPLRPKSLAALFCKARSACGLDHIRFHDLRHFSLTMAAATGASTREQMRRGGHSTPAAALRYQHATEDRDRVIAHALGELLQADVVPMARPTERNA